MSTPVMDEAAKLLADPQTYADEARLHATLTHLRANAPVSWVDVENYRPFWAITKHTDIMDIERDNTLFTNWPRPVLTTAAGDEQQAAIGVKTLIHLDDPQHRVVRAIGSDWFRPKAMRALKQRVDELAKIYVDKMMQVGPECDFVQEVAVNYPLYVIMSLLGIPEADFPRMLKLTQELFGSDDNEFKRGSTIEDQLPVLLDMFGYFNEVTAARREQPTEDLASAIANARIDGEPLSDIETVSYYLIVATAGHDTTSATISGGLHALAENPDQLQRLRADLGLMPKATEEMIRWVTPSNSSCALQPRTPWYAESRLRQANPCCCPTYRATGTKRCSTTRSVSTSAGSRTSTWPSATGCTSAWGRHWPAWRSAASSPSYCPG